MTERSAALGFKPGMVPIKLVSMSDISSLSIWWHGNVKIATSNLLRGVTAIWNSVSTSQIPRNALAPPK